MVKFWVVHIDHFLPILRRAGSSTYAEICTGFQNRTEKREHNIRAVPNCRMKIDMEISHILSSFPHIHHLFNLCKVTMVKATDYLKNNRFFMISKSWCPDCHYAQAIWKKYGVSSKVTVLELDKLEDQKKATELEKEFTALSGRKWVPTIWFNGEVFGTEQTLKQLESLDQTEEVFKKAGLL